MFSHIFLHPRFYVFETYQQATGKVRSHCSPVPRSYLFKVRSGYAAPQNLQNYAIYLDSRIHAYSDLKHDAIRVQAETNRDMRNANSIDEGGSSHRGRAPKIVPPAPATTGPQRSKTIMGRKLRVMTVEKGLLRETKAVHKMIDALVECRVSLSWS